LRWLPFSLGFSICGYAQLFIFINTRIQGTASLDTSKMFTPGTIITLQKVPLPVFLSFIKPLFLFLWLPNSHILPPKLFFISAIIFISAIKTLHYALKQGFTAPAYILRAGNCFYSSPGSWIGSSVDELVEGTRAKLCDRPQNSDYL